LKLFDKAGQLDPNNPLLDAIRVFLATRQAKKERTLGRDLSAEFAKPPYGWDPNAVRVGVAALVRAGSLRLSIDKKIYTNPDDSTLQDGIRAIRTFDKVELLLEETPPPGPILTAVRTVLIRLTGKRKIDEVPAALSSEVEGTAKVLVEQASRAALWAEVATLALPAAFRDAKDLYDKILALTNPVQRVNEMYDSLDLLEPSAAVIRRAVAFTDRWGKSFNDMKDFAATVNSIEYHLPADGAAKKFLGNWEAACSNASVIEEQVWKDLQNSKAAAQVELESQKAKWRETSSNVIQRAIDKLAGDLESAGISDSQFLAELTGRLEAFRNGLANESSVTRAPLLPEMARTRVQEIETRVRERKEELARAADKASDSDGDTPKKPKRVRLGEPGKPQVIASLQQWNKLDTAVRQELAAGNEVEIG
jgi:hypothetical protein